MSKIVQAVNSMIANSNLISSVRTGSWDKEYFFLYNKKYVWSIFESDEKNISLAFYPEDSDPEKLASIPQEYWHEEDIKMITYRYQEIGTKEAESSFKELYQVVKEKVYGMDDILNDIIGIDF